MGGGVEGNRAKGALEKQDSMRVTTARAGSRECALGFVCVCVYVCVHICVCVCIEGVAQLPGNMKGHL